MEHSGSHLPDLFLLAVFKYIPTIEMLRGAVQVCTNWDRLRAEELRSRHVLVIAYENVQLNDYDDNPYASNLISHVCDQNELPLVRVRSSRKIEFDTIRLPLTIDLTEAFTSPLMNLLPNITKLTLYLRPVCQNTSLTQVIRLINYYATGLISLALGIDCSFCAHDDDIRNDTENLMRQLFNSINLLKSLQHLTLDVNLRNLDFEPDLSILSSSLDHSGLVTFTSNQFNPVQPLFASLRRYSNVLPDKLRIGYGSKVSLNELINLVRGRDQQLAHKFAQVHVDDTLQVENNDNLRLFCEQFVSLQSLSLRIGVMPMAMLAQRLSQLPQLVHLIIQFSIIPVEEPLPQYGLPQVTSVRMLILTLNTLSHHDTERLHLHAIFPNLQVLYLSHKESQEDFYEEPEIPAKFVECMRLAGQPFLQCANLHTIKLETPNEDIQSLLPQGLITKENGLFYFNDQ